MMNAGRARCRVEQLAVCSRAITLQIDSMFDGGVCGRVCSKLDSKLNFEVRRIRHSLAIQSFSVIDFYIKSTILRGA